MSFLLLSRVRRSRFLYPRLRKLKYTLWNVPIVGRLVPDPIELPQMEEIGRQSSIESMTRQEHGPRVLFFALRGWSNQVAWDATLAAALRLRGARVSFFTCGKRLPLCDIASHHASPPTPCSFCAPYVNRALGAWQFPVTRLRDLVSPAEVRELQDTVAAQPYEEYGEFVSGGLPIGRLVQTSVRWFLCSGTIGEDALARRSYRDFLASGAIMARALPRLLDRVKPDQLYVLNGLFFAERILLEIARARGLPVVTHEVGFLPNTQVFAHDRIAGHFEHDDVWPQYIDRPLSESEAEQLDEYLEGRRKGRRDAAKYYPSIEQDSESIAAQLGLDVSKPLVVAFTNILWDSAVLDRDRAFPNMVEWLDATVRHFAARQDVQFAVRIHPAEVRLSMQETREQVAPLLAARHPNLPEHVKIISPESAVSSYALMHMSRAGLVYTSTTGLEMALTGKPVIVAGRTHYAGKGFTHDVRNPEEYTALLHGAAGMRPLPPDQLALARRYAYLFFFRTMLPFPAVTLLPGARVQFNFGSLDELEPGHLPEIDLICRAILENRPFLRDSLGAGPR